MVKIGMFAIALKVGVYENNGCCSMCSSRWYGWF